VDFKRGFGHGAFLGNRPSCELRVFFKITYVCRWSNHDLEILMSRAGREPAEDLKKRLVAACQEVGLTVRSAQMILMKEAGTRVIHVDGCPENWPHESPMLGLMVNITTGGQWNGTVDIRCCGTEDDPVSGRTPWMKGRSNVMLEELVEQLRETLDEREKVIAAIKFGIEGPYRFERSIWEVVDLLGGRGTG